MDEANKFTPDEAVAQITPEIPTDPEARLEYFKPLIQEALDECARVIAEIEDKKSRGEHVDITPFDARAKLYELAMALAGEARSGDIVAMLDFIKPQKGEVGVDVSAGTGFLTKSVKGDGSLLTRPFTTFPAKKNACLLADRQISRII